MAPSHLSSLVKVTHSLYNCGQIFRKKNVKQQQKNYVNQRASAKHTFMKNVSYTLSIINF